MAGMILFFFSSFFWEAVFIPSLWLDSNKAGVSNKDYSPRKVEEIKGTDEFHVQI